MQCGAHAGGEAQQQPLNEVEGKLQHPSGRAKILCQPLSYAKPYPNPKGTVPRQKSTPMPRHLTTSHSTSPPQCMPPDYNPMR
ncbi:unnamed protein product [Coregonus sp. 'balchen']|nr:unnamed protein product [Coregonus sp. 'balchen']